jgi:hypothetical protein
MRVLLAATLALTAFGCGNGGGTAVNDLEVTNASAITAELSWQSPGLLGTDLFPATGTEAVAGCEVYRRGFGEGHHVVRISADSNSLVLNLEATADSATNWYVVIDANGTITQVDQSSNTERPCHHESPAAS